MITEYSPETFRFVPPELTSLPEAGAQWSAETRRDHLSSLPQYGFNPEQYQNTIDDIVAVGLPVNNYRSLHRRANEKGQEGYVGSWGQSGHIYGEFSLYEHLEKLIPEERLATITHEGLHAVTPFDPNNAHLYGSEAERLAVAEHVEAVTNQSLLTGTHLDGYHKSLIERYFRYEIDGETLLEETHAIMGEMAIVNRNGLVDLQERQQKGMADLNRIRRLQGQPEIPLVQLITKEGMQQPCGVDKALLKLMGDVDSMDGLRLHAYNLKARLYTPRSIEKVINRDIQRGGNLLTIVLAHQALVFQIEMARRAAEDDDEAED